MTSPQATHHATLHHRHLRGRLGGIKNLKMHLIDAHQHPVDQSHHHHLLEVLHRRVLVDLLHDEVRDEPGDVPSEKRGFCLHPAGSESLLKHCNKLSGALHSLHAAQMHDPQHDGGLHAEQDEEVHRLRQEPLQRGGDGVLLSWRQRTGVHKDWKAFPFHTR